MFYVWCTVAAVATFVGSLAAAGVALLFLPTDFFVRHSEPQLTRPQSVGGWAWRIGHNIAGVVILIAGIVMIFTPGQGLLSILLGLILIDFPGKHAVVRRILRNGKVVAAANRWRAKFGKPALEHPNHD